MGTLIGLAMVRCGDNSTGPIVVIVCCIYMLLRGCRAGVSGYISSSPLVRRPRLDRSLLREAARATVVVEHLGTVHASMTLLFVLSLMLHQHTTTDHSRPYPRHFQKWLTELVLTDRDDFDAGGLLDELSLARLWAEQSGVDPPPALQTAITRRWQTFTTGEGITTEIPLIVGTATVEGEQPRHPGALTRH